MGDAKQPGKVQKSAPWVAIATAAIVPFFTYLQARDESRAAQVKAAAAERAASAGAEEMEDVAEGQGAVYQLLVRELERVADDSDACHERVDLLADALEEISTRRPRMGRGEVPSRVMEQRAIERPAAAHLPKAKADVDADDPLRGVLSD